MPKFVEFKEYMKRGQLSDKEVMNRLFAEIKELRRRATKKDTYVTPNFIKNNFPFLYRQVELRYFEENRTQLENHRGIFFLDLDTHLDKIIQDSRKLYSENQTIINAMDNDKIINYIDLERLCVHLVESFLSAKDSLDILGAVVSFDMKYLQKHPNVEVLNSWCVEDLSFYFNEDGTFKENASIEDFKECLLEILEAYIKTCKDYLEVGYFNDSKFNCNVERLNQLLNECCKLLEQGYRGEKVSNQKFETTLDTLSIKPSVDRKYIEELRKYYRNNEIVCIPEDMDMFMELLDNCEIDEKEKKYILNLISELKEIEEHNELKYLNPSDKLIYERALSILNGLHHTDGDYYVLVQLLDDLKAALNILCETESEEDKEYLEAEVSDLIIKIEEVVNKYGEEKLSENTILFLLDENMVPYIKQDSELLDGSFYKMVCNGIKKIRKDNQSNFRLVMTNDNISYRVYDILSSKIHLSFIEIDSGIYVLIGCDVISHGYEDIVKRAHSHESEIKELELLVKNDNSRNRVLTEHEQYFELFNPDDRDMTKKRIN